MQYCDLWIMEPGALRQMHALASAITPEVAELARQNAPQERRQKAVAILPIRGALEPRHSPFGVLFGMTSTEAIGQAFDKLVSDDSVGSIVLDVASPGGMVYGVPELAAKIFAARGTKPIVAVANPMAASGGYWIAAAADRVIASPSADVGSVGVIVSRFDTSAQMEREGVKETVVRSAGSPFKGEFVESEPLTDEGKQHLQGRADQIFEQFAGDLAKFRGVSVDYVRERFGKGRLVDSASAIGSNMIDRVMTLEETVMKLASNRLRIGNVAAQDVWDAPTPAEERRFKIQERATAARAAAEAN